MNYTLEQFCEDCHKAFAADGRSTGRKAVQNLLEKLLVNEEFITQHLKNQSTGKSILYHDKEFDFYVMAHGTDHENRKGKPHDHGPSWAVYGQATGTTNMTLWNRLDDNSHAGYAELKEDHTFALEPGKAALFDTGIIHSTAHPRPARWVRVTGTNLDTIERYSYDPGQNSSQRMIPA